jgi:hypothetical protein
VLAAGPPSSCSHPVGNDLLRAGPAPPARICGGAGERGRVAAMALPRGGERGGSQPWQSAIGGRERVREGRERERGGSSTVGLQCPRGCAMGEGDCILQLALQHPLECEQ